VSWTPAELDAIGGAEELRIASRRPDGRLRPAATVWVVRVGDDLLVRSAYGRGNGWFRRAEAAGEGRVAAGGVERDVRFDDADPADHEAVDAAYRAKYAGQPPQHVAPVVSPESWTATFRLVPIG